MRLDRKCLLVSIGVVLCAASAQAVNHVDASVIQLRTDCGTLDDCYTTMAQVQTFAFTTRNPALSATDPLLVLIGPGEFTDIRCNGSGWVTYRGSGRDKTFIKGSFSGIEVFDCTDIAVEDLTLEGVQIGAYWQNGGTGTWTDVDMIATGSSTFGSGWFDICYQPYLNAGGERSVHYLFNVRAITKGAPTTFPVAYVTLCAETWFFSGEIRNEASSFGVQIADLSDFRTFGTPIRVQSGSVGILNNGIFHSHGGVINVAGPFDVIAVATAGEGAFSHTPGTAYAMKPGPTGKAQRVLLGTGGVAQVPFHWGAFSAPPVGGAVESVGGKDSYVETDCDDTGDCDAAGSEPHPMVYSSVCTVDGPWFDTVTGRCRNDTTP